MNISNLRRFTVLTPNALKLVNVTRVDNDTFVLQRQDEDRKDKISGDGLRALLGDGWTVAGVTELEEQGDFLQDERNARAAETDALANRIRSLFSRVEVLEGGDASVRIVCDVVNLLDGFDFKGHREAVAFKLLPETDGSLSGVHVDASGIVQAVCVVTTPDVAMLAAAKKIIRQSGETWERSVPGKRWMRTEPTISNLARNTNEHMAGLLQGETVVVTMFPIGDYREYLQACIKDAQVRASSIEKEHADYVRGANTLAEERKENAARIEALQKTLAGLGE